MGRLALGLQLRHLGVAKATLGHLEFAEDLSPLSYNSLTFG